MHTYDLQDAFGHHRKSHALVVTHLALRLMRLMRFMRLMAGLQGTPTLLVQ